MAVRFHVTAALLRLMLSMLNTPTVDKPWHVIVCPSERTPCSGEFYPPSITWFNGPPPVHTPSGISVGSSIFAQLTNVSISPPASSKKATIFWVSTTPQLEKCQWYFLLAISTGVIIKDIVKFGSVRQL